MDRKPKETIHASSNFPYEMYMDAPVWEVVNAAIDDLVKNGDLVETTRRDYIVGYICKKLGGLLP
jgi:hypothetical protein